jgi:hypothetical protein
MAAVDVPEDDQPQSPTSRPRKMRAIVYRRYGPPDVLELTELDRPTASAGEVLVQVVAAAVNPGDWDFTHGTPYILRPMIGLRRPRDPILGLADEGGIGTAYRIRTGDLRLERAVS